MKLLYSGKSMFDPKHIRRQARRRWFFDNCMALAGTVAFLLGLWLLIILMFVM